MAGCHENLGARRRCWLCRLRLGRPVFPRATCAKKPPMASNGSSWAALGCRFPGNRPSRVKKNGEDSSALAALHGMGEVVAAKDRREWEKPVAGTQGRAGRQRKIQRTAPAIGERLHVLKVEKTLIDGVRAFHSVPPDGGGFRADNAKNGCSFKSMLRGLFCYGSFGPAEAPTGPDDEARCRPVLGFQR